MTPPSVLRQAPTPTQRSEARTIEPSSLVNAKWVSLVPKCEGPGAPAVVLEDAPTGWRRFSNGIVDAHGIRELAGIHAVVRIPERLEFAKGLDELGAEHFWEQRGARLAVAVLTRERAAKREDDICRAVYEFAEYANAFGTSEIEVDAHVDASLAVVAIERTAEAVLRHETGDGAEIFSELRGRNGGILPPLPAIGLAGHKDHGAERGFANMPDRLSFIGRANMRHWRRGPGLRGLGYSFGFGAGLLGRGCTDFDKQKANSGRKLVEVAESETLAAHEVDEKRIEAFEADGLVLERERNRIGGEECVIEAKHGEHAEGRAGGEVQRGGEDIGACALRPDQRARNIEVALRKQLVEVIAGDTAWDAGKLFSNESGVTVADAREARVDLTDAASSEDKCIKTLGRCGSNGHARAVVENDVERFNVVYDLAAEQAMHAATVVTDHAAKRAAGVRRGIGRVGELMRFGGVAQTVKDNAWLDACKFGAGVQGRECVHVPRVIKDHGHIDALAGEACAGTTREHSSARGAAGGQCRLNVGRIARKNDADGELAIVRRVRGVKSA